MRLSVRILLSGPHARRRMAMAGFRSASTGRQVPLDGSAMVSATRQFLGAHNWLHLGALLRHVGTARLNELEPKKDRRCPLRDTHLRAGSQARTLQRDADATGLSDTV